MLPGAFILSFYRSNDGTLPSRISRRLSLAGDPCSEFKTTSLLRTSAEHLGFTISPNVPSVNSPGHLPDTFGGCRSRMRFKQGQVWRCLNDACGAQLLVTESGVLHEGGNPRCCCGSLMKMPYEHPKIRFSEESQEVRRLLQQLSTVLR